MTDEQRERRKAQNRASYLRNREKVLARSRARQKANREKLNARARERRRENPEKFRAYSREYIRKYREKYPERIEATQTRFEEKHPNYSAEWFLKNREKKLAQGRKWQEENPGKNASYSRAYTLLKAKAMPPWVDRKELDAFYIEAKQKEAETGIPHEVDHIFPIKGKGFVGLHVPWNLRVITKIENRKKLNRKPDFMLLPQPPQTQN